MSELVALIPVLHRPHRIQPVLDSFREATPDQRLIFIPDPDDEPEIAAIRKAGAEFFTHDGNYASKINQGVRVTAEPLIFFGASDLKFHPGWLEAAKEKLDVRTGVVATNDQCQTRVLSGELATHPLVTRAYAELGKVDGPDPLHAGYPHEYVDREFSETAIFRKAFAYAPESIVEHLHPLVGKAPMDDLYAGMRDRMRQGRLIYARRRRQWMNTDPHGKGAWRKRST